MKTRLIIGPLLIALVAALFWLDHWLAAKHGAPPWGFIALASAAGAICVYEVSGLLKLAGLPCDCVSLFLGTTALLVGVSSPLPSAFGGSGGVLPVLASGALLSGVALCFLLVLVCARNIWHPDVKRFPPLLAGTLAAFVYAAVPAALLISIRRLATPADPSLGLWLIIGLTATVRLGADTFAYFVGKAVGRNKLIPHVSPGKTVEGFFGGLAGAVGVGWGCWAVMPGLAAALDLGAVLAFSAAVGLVAPVGDLAASALKRGAGAKDSGKLLPEFGGVLDVIDGLLLSGPLLYLVLLLWALMQSK